MEKGEFEIALKDFDIVGARTGGQPGWEEDQFEDKFFWFYKAVRLET